MLTIKQKEKNTTYPFTHPNNKFTPIGINLLTSRQIKIKIITATQEEGKKLCTGELF